MGRKQAAPRTHLVSGDWPTGVVDPSPVARYCQLVVIATERERLRRGWSKRELARRAGISHRTLGYLLDGETNPDLGTLALLEAAFGVELLPGDRFPGLNGAS